MAEDWYCDEGTNRVVVVQHDVEFLVVQSVEHLLFFDVNDPFVDTDRCDGDGDGDDAHARCPRGHGCHDDHDRVGAAHVHRFLGREHVALVD